MRRRQAGRRGARGRAPAATVKCGRRELAESRFAAERSPPAKRDRPPKSLSQKNRGAVGPHDNLRNCRWVASLPFRCFQLPRRVFQRAGGLQSAAEAGIPYQYCRSMRGLIPRTPQSVVVAELVLAHSPQGGKCFYTRSLLLSKPNPLRWVSVWGKGRGFDYASGSSSSSSKSCSMNTA